ncbi:MAG: FkbM family methyltransferase [Bacteroidota bacterium]
MAKIDQHVFQKAYLKARRKIDSASDTDLKIKAGPLKGYKWSLSIDNNKYLIGIYETDMAEKFHKYVKPGSVVFDVGANAGYFTMLSGMLTGNTGKVYAFEPMPANLSLLNHHLSANEVTNVEVISKALSNQKGEVQFTNSDNLAANTYVADSPMFQQSSGTITVETISMDELLEENPEVRPPNLIKIDVEGAELDVLKGARKTFLNHRPILFLATHDCHIPGIKQECFNFLEGIGYQIDEIKDDKIDGQEDVIATFRV